MALLPEDVVNKRFQQTKFREGYDQDEVDDFLDEVVIELRRLNSDNEELKVKLASAEARLKAGESLTVQQPTIAPPSTNIDEVSATSSANDLLTLARRLHEEHVREGVEKRDALIAEGHETATRLVSEAEATVKTQLNILETEKATLRNSISELSSFEKEYREKLRNYISSQLVELDEIKVSLNQNNLQS